jgi:hypothetical protein
MVTDKKQGRNELCDCGSGKKFKKCCGAFKEITLRDMMKCFYLLLEGASQENLAFKKGPIPFSKKMLDGVPKDFVQQVTMVQNEKFLVLSVKPEKKKLIETVDFGKQIKRSLILRPGG